MLIFGEKKKVKQQYLQLLEEVKTLPFYKIDLTHRVNYYVCTCMHLTKTIDVDAGVTPMMILCERCGKHAMSTGYKADYDPPRVPSFEWFRPSLPYVILMRRNKGYINHILSGGLDLRKHLVKEEAHKKQ